MRIATFWGLALASLNVLTSGAMARSCDPEPCRENRSPRRQDCDDGRQSLEVVFGIPAKQPRAYIPAPQRPSFLTIGSTVYNVDGGNGLALPGDGGKRADKDAANSKDIENVRFHLDSSAGTVAERNRERRELQAALQEALGFDEFNRICERISRIAPGAPITIVYGDTSEHSHSTTAGGTFVPNWEDSDDETGFRGGTLIIDKARLQQLRPDFDYREFLVEILTHEMVHALQYAQGHEPIESPARAAGERAAEATDHRTLAGTLRCEY